MTRERFAQLCRETGGEGIVLLRNEGHVLPLAKGSRVSLFGRIQNHYIKSGTGSGGLVNVDYMVGIPQGLESAGIQMDPELAKVYRDWEQDHPFDRGNGWATEPWAQEEMPLTEEIVKSARENSDTAIIIIGRTAGEDRDNMAEKGSYLLTDVEEEMLSQVTSQFSKVIVVLNVGNIIDMKWVEKYQPAAVLYAWQGGQEGGNAVADVLAGVVSPSGKLTDTIACDIADYPSTKYFGGELQNQYWEDIYVGYRYFCTFAPEKVLYPFGFGLSYTTFSYENAKIEKRGEIVSVSVVVKNIGSVSGKEVVQVYCSAPQGKLRKPERVLAAYGKTHLLAPGEWEKIELTFGEKEIASFDDTGITGHQSCFVLEQGQYLVHISANAQSDLYTASFAVDADTVVEVCHQAMASKQTFDGLDRTIPAASVDLDGRMAELLPEEIPQTGDQGIKLEDVKSGKATMETFLAQLTDEDLACIGFGEGMNSPKVTGGTGCAFGGVTTSLLQKGIPLACGTDATSGLRMDCGATATSLPNATLIACTWNDALVQELYIEESQEMCDNNVDALLGPGLNIHRNPLNGRNFEYFSEDPLLSGRIGAAICKGIAQYGNTATVKHFCCNNQETGRHDVDSVVSERALREIYLKPFEIVLREDSACQAVMTAYNPVNGIWASSHFDLNTTILREEWGFRGFVMSDWWAKTGNIRENRRTEARNAPRDFVPSALAQNDIFMVCENAADFRVNNLLEAVQSGRIPRAALQRNARNVCRFLMQSNAIDRRYDICEDIQTGSMLAAYEDISVDGQYTVSCEKAGSFVLKADILSVGSALSQNTAIFYANGKFITSFTVCGSDGQVMENMRMISLPEGQNTITAQYPDKAIFVCKLQIFEKGN